MCIFHSGNSHQLIQTSPSASLTILYSNYNNYILEWVILGAILQLLEFSQSPKFNVMPSSIGIQYFHWAGFISPHRNLRSVPQRSTLIGSTSSFQCHNFLRKENTPYGGAKMIPIYIYLRSALKTIQTIVHANCKYIEKGTRSADGLRRVWLILLIFAWHCHRGQCACGVSLKAVIAIGRYSRGWLCAQNVLVLRLWVELAHFSLRSNPFSGSLTIHPKSPFHCFNFHFDLKL